ncbi:hypothetical protein [Salinifilum aidingensis]
MDPHDIDGYALPDSPPPRGGPAPAVAPGSEREAAHQPTASASGNSSFSVGRDLVQGDKTEIIVQARPQKKRGRGLQDPEALQRLAASYVPPPGLLDEPADGESQTAFQTLHRRRVLLIGAQGFDCGQFAAAQRLGYELQKTYSALVVREELSDPGFRMHADALLVERQPAAVLIDLRKSELGDIREVQRGLVEFTEQLEQYRSYLILLLPPEHTSWFEEQFPGRTYLLGKPSSTAVFEHHLVGADGRALVERTDSAQSLEHLWPPKVRELAETVSDRIKQGSDPEHVLRGLLDNELHSRTPELRKRIKEHQANGNAEWLALLLAASLLERASAKHIVEASDRMLELNQVERQQPVPLLRLSPFVRLGDLDEEYFDPENREFRFSDFGAQVLRHFWREHPDIRPRMLDWIRQLPDRIRDLERNELENLVDRVADLSGEGGGGIPVKLAREWAMTKAGKDSGGTETSNTTSDRSRRSIAVRLLTTTAMDPTLGRDVRQKLWEWSRGESADLQLMTAEVCAGIGQSFPRVALTRLKHLANTENRTVRKSVHDAVHQIGIELDGSQFLRYVSEWFDGASPARLHLLSEAVADVLKEQSEEIDVQVATSFWKRALASMPPQDSRTIVQSWLRAASAVSPRQRDSMVESLVHATDSDSIVIAQVHRISWGECASRDLGVLGDDPMASVVHQLWTRLDEVDPLWQ